MPFKRKGARRKYIAALVPIAIRQKAAKAPPVNRIGKCTSLKGKSKHRPCYIAEAYKYRAGDCIKYEFEKLFHFCFAKLHKEVAKNRKVKS